MFFPDKDGLFKINDVTDIVAARAAARDLAGQAGFGMADRARLATAVSELTRNVLQYAGGGTCEINNLSDDAHMKIVAIVEDHGSGIADIDKAMQDGFTTSGGLGAGLPGTKRLMDEFSIESRPGLTRVTITIIRHK